MMRVWHIAALLAAGVSGTTLAAGQTKVDLGAQSKDVDFSRAISARPFPMGTMLPATCSIGQMYFLTGVALAVNECLAANIWTPIQGLSGLGILNVQWTSGTVLTIGPQCSVSTPCLFRIGSTVYSVTAPATVTLTGGSGLAYIYIDNNGNLLAGVSSSTVTCAGCQVAGGITQYPIATIPLETWNATNGVWDPTGSNDIALLTTQPALNAGSNITITQSGPNVTIAASGAGGTGGPTGTYFNPMDPTQWYRDHITLATGFNNGQDGWSYEGPCSNGSGSGPTGFSSESVLPTVWPSVAGAGSSCFYAFPTAGNSAYGTGTYDYWSGPTPASLWVSATYRSADTNGAQYVGLGIFSGSDFMGCRQTGSGDWFAVIHVGGIDVASADTGVAHDGNTHRLVVDNASGTINTIRCSVDGRTPATASGTIPVEPSGWMYMFGATSNGSATTFAPFQYTIFLQGLPRL
jgi:hypothetical protein